MDALFIRYMAKFKKYMCKMNRNNQILKGKEMLCTKSKK